MQDEAISSPSARRRSWRLPFSWLGLFAVAWVVYELTHSPALAAVFVCLKFGWEDFATACWLIRTDPERSRGRATFWLYLAWGLWKTALVAFLMSIGFATVAKRGPLPQALGQTILAFLSTFLTTLIGFGLATLMTFLAIFFASRAKVRLWLDNGVHRARRQGYFPPAAFCEGRTNRIGELLLTSFAVSFLTVLCGLLTLLPQGELGGILSFVLSLTAPLLVVFCREAASERIRAESAEECWPEPEGNDPWQEGEEVL